MAARTPAQRRASARQSGFTMLELMITVSLVVILGMIIIPSFSYVMSANRATSQINGLLGDIQFARAEAIKEGLSVGICASSNGTTCSGSATWTSGWIVYADTAGTGYADRRQHHQVHRVQPRRLRLRFDQHRDFRAA
jgi:type IV fimbrial biogenesis protein FimT